MKQVRPHSMTLVERQWHSSCRYNHLLEQYLYKGAVQGSWQQHHVVG